MKIVPIIATLLTLAIATSATAQIIPTTTLKIENSSLTKVRVIRNGTKLRIYDGKIIQTIDANSLKVRVLDSLTCEGKQIKRQTLAGKTFFSQAIELNKQNGNLAVGVLLQDCFGKNISAAFILQPKPNWNNYIVHRVPVPGERQINNRFSTYPLRRIKQIRFLDGNLLIKHANSTNSEALLVFTLSKQPFVKYAGCVVTQQSDGDSICPSFN